MLWRLDPSTLFPQKRTFPNTEVLEYSGALWWGLGFVDQVTDELSGNLPYHFSVFTIKGSMHWGGGVEGGEETGRKYKGVMKWSSVLRCRTMFSRAVSLVLISDIPSHVLLCYPLSEGGISEPSRGRDLHRSCLGKACRV